MQAAVLTMYVYNHVTYPCRVVQVGQPGDWSHSDPVQTQLNIVELMMIHHDSWIYNKVKYA